VEAAPITVIRPAWRVQQSQPFGGVSICRRSPAMATPIATFTIDQALQKVQQPRGLARARKKRILGIAPIVEARSAAPQAQSIV
jgi:hypothetical protein